MAACSTTAIFIRWVNIRTGVGRGRARHERQVRRGLAWLAVAAAPSHPLAGAGLRIETVEGIAPVGAEWERLADAAGAGPFVRPGWFEAWLRPFAAGRGAVVLCARRGDRLAGVRAQLLPGTMVRPPTNLHTPGVRPVAQDAPA